MCLRLKVSIMITLNIIKSFTIKKRMIFTVFVR